MHTAEYRMQNAQCIRVHAETVDQSFVAKHVMFLLVAPSVHAYPAMQTSVAKPMKVVAVGEPPVAYT